MTRRRWIADEVSGNRAVLIGDHARHLTHVLRAKVGQEFDVSTGNDVRHGRITGIQPDRVEFELGEVVLIPSLLPITVALSIFKFDRMEWAIEKCTELGVAVIVPLIAARTEPHLAAAAPKRLERWRRLAHQASEQSRRILPPEIADPMKLDEALALEAGQRIVLSEAEVDRTLRDTLPTNSQSLVLAFGPEGGWKEKELDAFKSAGWRPASLGPTILRAETAVIAAVAIASSNLNGVVR
jgi:16S rRNA (uracil1498-N3)-methyltransferase